jgi:hypothetical protein
VAELPVNASLPVPDLSLGSDLYRLEGDRLYYLNGFRGVMVFDVSNVDSPKFMGRSPIFGWPAEMIVRNGIVTVVVADWYGSNLDGTPFHGSVVRALDATDPANVRVLGEAKLDGWVRETRTEGDVLYTVSERYDWVYGWDSYGSAKRPPYDSSGTLRFGAPVSRSEERPLLQNVAQHQHTD